MASFHPRHRLGCHHHPRAQGSDPCPATGESVGSLSDAARLGATQCAGLASSLQTACGNLRLYVPERLPRQTARACLWGLVPMVLVQLTSISVERQWAKNYEIKGSIVTPPSPAAHLTICTELGCSEPGDQWGACKMSLYRGQSPETQASKSLNPPLSWASQQGQGSGLQAASGRL